MYSCQNKLCNGVYWDKAEVKKRFRDDPGALDLIKAEAEVPAPLKNKKSHFVYTLRLKGEINSVYVGMTGLHPYERYLNHIRGYKSSRHTKHRATALIRFEGPMLYDKAVRREPELGLELEQQGYKVYGPQKIKRM